ncbi:MAG: YHS domain-containing protein [Deltaproteobacteria bacterium]|nr:MAG: YHS domain-containing protein [Deltaproteobacteria bacterium]
MKKSIGLLVAAAFVFAAGVFAPSSALACGECAKKGSECPHAKGKKGECKHDQQAKGEASAPVAFDKPPAVGTKATCPVSGKQFVVKADTARSTYKGKHYVFCCPGCKPKFDADPEKYLKKK